MSTKQAGAEVVPSSSLVKDKLSVKLSKVNLRVKLS